MIWHKSRAKKSVKTAHIWESMILKLYMAGMGPLHEDGDPRRP